MQASGEEGNEAALKEELWMKGQEEKYPPTTLDLVERFEEEGGALWTISFLFGLEAAAFVWIPTAPKHLARHHRRSHRRRSHSRHISLRL
jgi:hypothetical protein